MRRCALETPGAPAPPIPFPHNRAQHPALYEQYVGEASAATLDKVVVVAERVEYLPSECVAAGMRTRASAGDMWSNAVPERVTSSAQRRSTLGLS